MNFGVFLIGAIGFGIATLLLCWIGNKILNSMKKDNYKTEKEIREEKEKEINE